MKTRAQYEHDLASLSARMTPSLDAGGKAALLAEVTELERNLALDIQTLSMQYKGRAVSRIGSESSKIGRNRGTAEKKAYDEEQERLSPYKDLLNSARDLAAKLK